MFKFLRLSIKFSAVLRLSVNPIETLLTDCSYSEIFRLKSISNQTAETIKE